MPLFNICSPLIEIPFSLIISFLSRTYSSSGNYNIINYSLHITLTVMFNCSSFVSSRIPS
nr:MAG TPA: hypothetical protein [Bacteriophage sp.]